MKLAPWIAGSALAIVILTLSTARAIDPPEKVTTLDVSGIDTLEIRSNGGIEVLVDSHEPARVKYDDSTEAKVQVRRQGNRLTLDAKLDGYGNFYVRVPASVHRFVLSRGKVSSAEKLREVELYARDDVNWDADVERLVVRDIKDRSRASHCECSAVTDIYVAGKIGQGYFFSPHANLRLQQPDDIAKARAWLGPKGTVYLDGARRFDQVQLVDSEAELAAALASGAP